MEVPQGDVMANGLRLEIDTNFKIESLAPEGIGLGVGKISRKNRLESGEITETDLAKVREAINDPSYYPPVEFGDDGCSDGRGTVLIYRFMSEKTSDLTDPGSPQVQKVYYDRSGHRSKILGGGLNIGWAMHRVILGAPQVGDTLNNDRVHIAQSLTQRGLEFGGHIGSHAQGNKVGCIALDETVPIIGYSVEYANDLYDLTKKLKGDYFDDGAFNRTMEVFGAIADNGRYAEGASGQSALQTLDEYGALIKELSGPHNEVAYLRNHKPGTTFNQKRLNIETNDLAQLFTDDVWKRDMYANELGEGKDELIRFADMAGEIITLGTIILATDGSQEVYQRVVA